MSTKARRAIQSHSCTAYLPYTPPLLVTENQNTEYNLSVPSPQAQRLFIIRKYLALIHHHVKMSDEKKHLIVSLNAAKAFDKTRHPLVILKISYYDPGISIDIQINETELRV